jgi:hypothetical protein
MARTIHHNPFGQGIYPWGNVPAIDVLNLAQNEGNDHCPNIAILFAGWLYLLSFQLGKIAANDIERRVICATWSKPSPSFLSPSQDGLK